MNRFVHYIEKGNLIPYFIYTTYIAYIILYIGIFHIKPDYIDHFIIMTNLYISMTLLFYFNPFTNTIVAHPNLNRIVFTSGIVLFTNSIGKIIQVREQLQILINYLV